MNKMNINKLEEEIKSTEQAISDWTALSIFSIFMVISLLINDTLWLGMIITLWIGMFTVLVMDRCRTILINRKYKEEK